MKKSILILSVLAIIFTGCAQDKNTTHNNKAKKEAPVKPEKPKVSDQKLQKNITKTLQNDLGIKETENSKQAIQILNSTNYVLNNLAKNNIKKAKDELEKLIGESEVLMTKDPNVDMIPIDIDMEINDIVVDIPTVYEITDAADVAMYKGYYQTAKEILKDLTSEMTVKTAYLPLATYPDAMKLAATMLDKGDKEKAAQVLIEALNTIVVEEVVIPLPVLRAEEYIKLSAEALLTNDKNKNDIALLLLDNANYQLQLAQAMGYGKKDKEYKDLTDAIKDLKKVVKENKNSKGEFEKLSEKIKNFKDRLFVKKHKNISKKK